MAGGFVLIRVIGNNIIRVISYSMAIVKKYRAKVEKIKNPLPDIFTVTFSSNKKFQYNPGQFLQLAFRAVLKISKSSADLPRLCRVKAGGGVNSR